MSGFYMERVTLFKDAKSKFKQSVVFTNQIGDVIFIFYTDPPKLIPWNLDGHWFWFLADIFC
jgi:hypothetical protein